MQMTFQIATKTKDIHISGKVYQKVQDTDGNYYLFAESYPFPEGTLISADTTEEFGSLDMPDCEISQSREAGIRAWMDYYKTRIVINIKPLDIPDAMQERFECYMTLRQYLPAAYALQMVNTFNTDLLMQKVEENPYFFYGPNHDFPIENFSLIDNQTEVSTFDLRREQLTYCIYSRLLMNESQGHTWIDVKSLLQAVNNYLNRDGHVGTDMDLLVAVLNADERFHFDRTTRVTRVGLTKTYETEKKIAHQVHILTNIHPLFKEQVVVSPHLCKEQVNAVYGITDSGNLSILTGKPGTGKTTTIADILRQYVNHGNGARAKVIACLAPTGRAVSRMWEALCEELSEDMLEGVIHSTIHKFLGYGEPKFMQTKKLSAAKDIDLLIIDECSMVDIFLFAQLMDAVDITKCKVVLVGDKDQLPSIAAGNVLTDLIAIGVPTFYLNENHRSVKSIYDNGIRILECATESFTVDEHFIFLPEEKLDEVLYSEDFLSMDAMLLSPYRKAYARDGRHITGNTTELNEMLHKRYFTTNRVSIGDKVICNKNNYKKGCFNGEIGTVTAITEEGTHILFDDARSVALDDKEWDYAYALTVHKAQGSECPSVYIYLPKDAADNGLLSKELLYTAVTRAKNKAVIIGEEATVREIMKHSANQRRTYLRELSEVYSQSKIGCNK